ncbi:MAG TPA: hypothetical protein VH396_06225 [Chitinophagaceae bacterium]
MLKKLSIASLVILIIAGLMYTLVYFIFIPKTAMILMPLKWRHISSGQAKESYYVYLGRSATANDFWKYKGDLWFVKKGNYDFYLNIHYNTDTVAKFVRIYYKFHNGLFDKTENIRIDSL